MDNKQQLKNIICDCIDSYKEEIIKIGDRLNTIPELGYKEFKTSAVIKEVFKDLSLSFKDALAITGIKAKLKGKKSNVNICVIGEMDAVISPLHPLADSCTGAAHSCGHNSQMAAMLAVAYAFSKSNVLNELDGDITFMAVPAEEFVEIEYRQSLREKGAITYLGGKQELIHLGEFDDIDMAMMVHSQANTPNTELFVSGGSLGFVAKTVKFIGKEAHAGGAPHEGVNALNAAMAAMMCIHANRETFKDEDKIRVHPILTKGGDLVNIVPADINMETYVRGANAAAIADAAMKVDRSIKGACMAIGADSKITNIPGYLPLNQEPEMGNLFAENALTFLSKDNIHFGIDMIGSTDIGDLSNLIPCIQPTMGGYNGSAHSKEFTITDKEAAYILPAKLMAQTIIDLLYDHAEKALEIKKNFKPVFTKQEYLDYMESLRG